MGGVPLICAGQEVGYASTISFFTLNPVDWSSGQDIFAQYKKIMKVRKDYSTLITGTLKTYTTKDVIAFTHTLNDVQLLVLVNTRNAESALTLASDLKNTDWVNTFDLSEFHLSESLTMEPFEYLILKKK